MSTEGNLLERIPPLQEVTPDRFDDSTWPVYRFLRKPQHLDEFYRQKATTPIIIEGENETLLYLSRNNIAADPSSRDHLIRLYWDQGQISVLCIIVSPAKEAALETATMLWNLPPGDVTFTRIQGPNTIESDEFLGYFQSHCSATQIMRFFLTPKLYQTSLLDISRTSQGTDLEYTGFNVNNYLRRISIMPNVKELIVNIDDYERTADTLCQAFSAPVDSFKLTLNASNLEEVDLSSVQIAAKEIEICCTDNSQFPFPRQVLATVLNLVARSQRVESLKLSLRTHRVTLLKNINVPEITSGLIGVIKANQGLKLVQLGDMAYDMEWGKHARELLAAMKQNEGLRRINMDAEHSHDGYPVCIARDINRHFLYFNRFLRFGQEEAEPTRSTLVAETLCQCSNGSFELSYLLLEMYTDTICELLHDSLDNIDPLPGQFTMEAEFTG